MYDEKKNTQIAGAVKAVIFQNEENGYTVISIETTDGDELTVVGAIPYATVGENIIVTGFFENHTVHGQQFKAEYAERRMPNGAEAIFEYLASRTIKGIGPATATLIVNEFGDKSLEVIENAPDELAKVRGISRKKANEISKSFRKQVGLRRLVEYLSNFQIMPRVAVRLYHSCGDFALEILQENPYIIARESIGATFSEADALALSIGIDSESPERAMAAVMFELRHNSRNGHTFIPYKKLVDATTMLINVDPIIAANAVDMLVENGSVVREFVASQDACYTATFYEAETYTADKIIELANEKAAKPKVRIEEVISDIESELSVHYADLQLHALKIAAENMVMVLTGGPGTGKTTIVRAMVAMFDKMGLETLLTAPTGRAAKRMSELTGKDAVTIHRLLEAGYPEHGDELVFKRDEDAPLDCDVIIMDECSMVDICLMQALLSAMPENCRLVMVGDADQLPSVGPGNVFSDIIRSNRIPTVRLTEIFRQTKTSRIVANAHIINRGDKPDLHANIGDSDFFFLARKDENAVVNLVVELVSDRLPKNMGIPNMDIQVLTPTRKGKTGTKNLNKLMQIAMNPPSPGKNEKKHGEIVFREGDKVMQIRNNYDIIWSKPESVEYKIVGGIMLPVVELGEKPEHGTGIFNGDIGCIVAIDTENELLTVLYDDKITAYGFDMLSELEHAYAMTVHKSQGSEYRAVIFLTLDGNPHLMSRGILYTAVTRARELLIVVGNENTVYNMIDNHRITRRYSGLKSSLVEQ